MSEARTPLVLVVEDYPDAQDMYQELLTFSGFRVEAAGTGQEAVEKATRMLPDLILMDLSLPGMDGWEATRRIKRNARTSHIPVVAITGHALAGVSTSAKRAGCDLFLTKPCLPADLVTNIKKLLGKKLLGDKHAPRRGARR
jgi:two-component system, cell cycle response regulator DivK